MTSVLAERAPQAWIDAAWDEGVAAHPLPDSSAGRTAWLIKHTPDLRVIDPQGRASRIETTADSRWETKA